MDAPPSAPTGPIVFIVDDDPSVQRGLARLIRVAGLRWAVFSSVEEFIRREPSDAGGCIILDVKLPGLSGLDLQDAMCRANSMPIIFITGNGDIPMSVQAIKKGAVDFLTKPVDAKILLGAVKIALEKDKETRSLTTKTSELASRIGKLTARERDVMRSVITGMLNKQIAGELGISENTVKIHRHRVMEKMHVTSVAELVRLCAAVEFGARKDAAPHPAV
jgi:FixJ family two-component response regulator